MIEFFLRLTATMFCPKQHAEIALDARKIIILMLNIKNALAHRKSYENEELEALFHEE